MVRPVPNLFLLPLCHDELPEGTPNSDPVGPETIEGPGIVEELPDLFLRDPGVIVEHTSTEPPLIEARPVEERARAPSFRPGPADIQRPLLGIDRERVGLQSHTTLDDLLPRVRRAGTPEGDETTESRHFLNTKEGSTATSFLPSRIVCSESLALSIGLRSTVLRPFCLSMVCS